MVDDGLCTTDDGWSCEMDAGQRKVDFGLPVFLTVPPSKTRAYIPRKKAVSWRQRKLFPYYLRGTILKIGPNIVSKK